MTYEELDAQFSDEVEVALDPMGAWRLITALRTQLSSKDAEIAQMKDALKPFADRADRYDPPEHDDEDVDWDTSAPRLRVKHLRTAREVLKGYTHDRRRT